MARFCYVLFPGLTAVSVINFVNACKVRQLNWSLELRMGEKGGFFPPLIGFLVYTAQDTSIDALGDCQETSLKQMCRLEDGEKSACFESVSRNSY